jgi:hypothetical protein
MKKAAGLDPNVDAVVREILAGVSPASAKKLAAWRKPERDLHRLAHRDYVRAVRRNLGYRELKCMISAADKMLSRLGYDQPVMVSARALRRIASDLRFHLRAEPYDGPEGLALLGFYVNRQGQMLQRPLIYLNTAHVQAAVTVAFCHELGHYITTKLFNSWHEPVHLSFDADYASHLDDPVELAADALAAVRCYPEGLARRIFATPWRWGLVARTTALTGDAFSKVRAYIESHGGFGFPKDLPAQQNLNYLAGMIHYAKLRWALLAEYDL